MQATFAYRAQAVTAPDQTLSDVRLLVGDKVQHLAGRGGAQRETDLLRPWREKPQALPVLLGSGLGRALEQLLAESSGPVAVLDKEAPILAVTRVRERHAAEPRVLWIDEPDPAEALKRLTAWQMEQQGRPLLPVVNPVYQRLDPGYYAELRQALVASSSFDFWAKARYPKFQSAQPRMLLLTSQYFLMGEIAAACRRLGVEHRAVTLADMEIGRGEFVEQLLAAVLEFRPDFVFTINHLGVDREGVLIDLLERLELPLASWFVDNPQLILSLYHKLVSPITAIFTWDADNIAALRDLGFSHVEYLPLGTDAHRFAPPPRPLPPSPLDSQVAFVGNSMLYKVGHRLKVARPPRPLLLRYREVAAAFGRHEERSVRAFLAREFPELLPHYESLDTPERSLAFDALLTWEATRQYRKHCVEQLLPWQPLIVGDKGWETTFRHSPHPWRYHPELAYYDQLPLLYPRCAVNFNCTSKQMKGAVNQRVFDVPATGSFLLTDQREQLERLFEPGREVICYPEPEAVPELVDHYLRHPEQRKRVALAARERILAEHTYEHRLRSLMRGMARIFA